MLVSIIIPVFNESKTIFEILKKINKIKGFKKEIIIINDGSTDNTKKIIQKNAQTSILNLLAIKKIKERDMHAEKV